MTITTNEETRTSTSPQIRPHLHKHHHSKETRMSNVAVPVIVTLLLLVALGALAYYLYRKWDLQRRQQQLLAWAGRQIPYRAMDDAEAGQAPGDFPKTTPNPESQELRKFESSDHGFLIMAPADWEYHEGGPDDAAILQCISPDEATSYKRLSVAWDDVSWAPTTAKRFVQNMAQQLPAMVPNVREESMGPHEGMPERDAFELVYSVEGNPSTEGGPPVRLRFVNVVRMAGSGRHPREENNFFKAFTISFGVDTQSFQDALPLAYRLLRSFTLTPAAHSARPRGNTRPSFGSEVERAWRARSSFASGADGTESAVSSSMRSQHGMAAVAAAAVGSTASSPTPGGPSPSPGASHGPHRSSRATSSGNRSSISGMAGHPRDTNPNPGEILWQEEVWRAAGLHVQVPMHWRMIQNTESSDPVPTWVRLYSSGEEASGGSKQLRLVVMDLTCVRDANPSADLHQQLRDFFHAEVGKHPGWKVTAERTRGNARVFRVSARRNRVKTTSASWVAMHTGARGEALGHVATFTTAKEVFSQYERVAQHIFASLEGIGTSHS